ncbi:hypothetical protein VME0621_00105 [Vibrio mediterranei]|nr:hypothetical protein VME0621_00105 [Vibrio mediterranei]
MLFFDFLYQNVKDKKKMTALHRHLSERLKFNI